MTDPNFDRLKELVAEEKYDEAVTLLTRINEKHAKTSSDFIALAKTYGKIGDFPRSEKMFKKAFRLRPSKLMYHEMLEVCLETGRLKEADEYLKEYASLPMHDEFSLAVYSYRVAKKKGADRASLIEALKKVNDAEYSETWAYELAKLYYRAGMEKECKAECEKIISAFEYSSVAAKAKMLLAFYNGEVTVEDIRNSTPPARFASEEDKNEPDFLPPESPLGLDSVAQGVRDIISAEMNIEPEVEEEASEETDDKSEEAVEEQTEQTEGIDEEPLDILTGAADEAADLPEEIISEESEEVTEPEGEKEPEIEEISAEHVDPEIEEISAEHSDPEIEEITAEHADPEIEEITAEHTDPEIEEIVAEHFPSVKEENEEEPPKFGEEWYASDPRLQKGSEGVGDKKTEPDDEEDISRIKRSRSVLEEGFMRELNTRRFERTMPKYVLYSPKMNFSKSEIKEGKLRSLILEKGVDIEGICKNYFRIDDLRRQILKSLELAVNERDALCFVVTGDEQTGKSTLALTMIHLMFEIGAVKFERTAKIKGERLNRIDLAEKTEELKDCNILIENAGALSGNTLTSLVELFGQKKNGGCLILEDNVKNINALFRKNDQYNGKFNNRIHLPKYGTDELMGFAYDVFADADYAIEASAADNFKKMISKKTTGNVPRLPAVLEMAQKAVKNADERLTPEILKMAAEAAIENYNLVILNEDLKP